MLIPKLLLINASLVFEKGDPKNFIPEAGIERIARTFVEWREEEKFCQIVDRAEIRKNDYNISPSRYIHTGDEESIRPIKDILSELDSLEIEAEQTDKLLRQILKGICV